MSRLGVVSLTFDDYLRRRDPFSSRFREVVITHDCNMSFVDICNVLLRWHGELGIYLSCIANGVKSFETEDGTLFMVSIPCACLSYNETNWLKNYLDAIISDTPTFLIEKISGWYGLSDGIISLTISLAPMLDYSLDIEPKSDDTCEVTFSANACYHYFISGDEIDEEINATFYDDVKEALDEFERSHQDLDLRADEPIFIPNEELCWNEGGVV